ncbi:MULTISPECIES: DUF5658 family protein [Bacillaceae]|uniref:DUF5658 family protein n=1 Tax=Bacillaceae TaxID=186817 RepID=UPI000C78F1FD|nr:MULTISPECIES: DUF5658 family protein [Bacillaceae]PLR68108.1 hypothetical protein CYJ36_08310 [Bacillus sp. UMB0893]QNG61244.1 hypothetical protein H4O14_07140 [Bacillus sp. PAMC26568]
MKYAFILLAVVNVFDAFLTVAGLQLHVISEANPIMKWLYEVHPLIFIGFKLSFSLFLYMFIQFKCLPATNAVKFVSYIALIAYAIVLFMHAIWLKGILI